MTGAENPDVFKALDVIRRAREAGLELDVRDGSIVASPRSALTDELLALIRANKPMLVTVLSATYELPAPALLRRAVGPAGFGWVAGAQQRDQLLLAPEYLDGPITTDERRAKVLALLESHPSRPYAVIPDQASREDVVILAFGIRRRGMTVTGEIECPRSKWDPWALFELIRQHGDKVH